MYMTSKFLFPAAAVIGACAGALVLVAVPGQAPHGIDTTTTASINPGTAWVDSAERFMVVDHTAGTTCIVNLHKSEGYSLHRVEPASNCGSMDMLADAHAWHDMGDGQIMVKDAGGETLLELGPSDGFAYV